MEHTNALDDLTVGRFRVHLVQEGERYGADGSLTYGDAVDNAYPHIGERVNDCQLYGHGLPLVEFYDTSQDPAKFPGGQFVTRYYMSTLLGMDRTGNSIGDMSALSLDGDIPEWTVGGSDLQEVYRWLCDARDQLQPEENAPVAATKERDASYAPEFNYRLLGRLQSDCDYYLGACASNDADMTAAQKHLWAGSIEGQIAKMRELYDALPEKPEWISADDIDRYEERMLAQRDKPALRLTAMAAESRAASQALSGDRTDGSPNRSGKDIG